MDCAKSSDKIRYRTVLASSSGPRSDEVKRSKHLMATQDILRTEDSLEHDSVRNAMWCKYTQLNTFSFETCKFKKNCYKYCIYCKLF